MEKGFQAAKPDPHASGSSSWASLTPFSSLGKMYEDKWEESQGLPNSHSVFSLAMRLTLSYTRDFGLLN